MRLGARRLAAPNYFNRQKKLREFLLAFIYGLTSVIFGEEEQKSKNLDE